MDIETKKVLKIIIDAMEDKKAQDIKVIKISDLTIISEYFVLATGTSSTQIKTIADEVEEKLSKGEKIEPLHREGYSSGNWILLDYANVVVHVFNPDSREFYDLEHLWNDGEIIDLESLKD